MNPRVAASPTHPLHFRRHGVIFAKSRELLPASDLAHRRLEHALPRPDLAPRVWA